ncbi:MAG: phosphatidylglycerophosphatase A [Vicinamibacterales bacterium]|nr:phosphatidylglycerophosphatase A [Vicinamibacterales bacterium]
MRLLARLVSTVAYIGYLPIAPGTWGSAAGLAVYAAVRATAGPVAELAVVVVLLAAGVWSATVTGHEMGDEDPGPVVIDEVVGMLVTVLWLPVGLTGAVAGFFLFRLFDIVKPFPARQFERLPGGWGVMLDDVMAGIYGNLALRLLMLTVPAWLS